MSKIHALTMHLASQVLQALCHPTDELRQKLQEQDSKQEKQWAHLKAQHDGLDQYIIAHHIMDD